MRIFLATSLYTLITLSVLQDWLILAGVAIIIFSLRFNAAALIPLAIMIDGYFGHFHAIPFLSFFAIWWFLLVEYLRPKVFNICSFSV